mmetsp:Transcript_26011/g.64419  ORF Transcript_26011/g.64419 Transcript_26011/m.64419 type:complete len:86 (+) Transcript_26011:154-411(+)
MMRHAPSQIRHVVPITTTELVCAPTRGTPQMEAIKKILHEVSPHVSRLPSSLILVTQIAYEACGMHYIRYTSRATLKKVAEPSIK